LFVCLFVCLFVYLFVCLFVCLFVEMAWYEATVQRVRPVKRFIPISWSDRVVQLNWYTPLPQDFGRAIRTQAILGESMPNPSLTLRYNTGLTAAPASPLYGSPVCKRSPIQVYWLCSMLLNFRVIEGTGAFNSLHMAVGSKIMLCSILNHDLRSSEVCVRGHRCWVNPFGSPLLP
jgi:hypothetical protein